MFDPRAPTPPATGVNPKRDQFLSSVRHALGHSEVGTLPAPPGRPGRSERLIRQVRADDPRRVERWIDLAGKTGVKVKRARSAGVEAVIDECLNEHQVKSVMVNLADLPEDNIAAHLTGTGRTVFRWALEGCAQAVFDCDASITDCRYGLADTGAMMVWSDPGFGRSTTLTVPVHVVLLPAGRILADMIDALPHALRDTGGRMPSNVVIINGPSKTADIEMKLVTGVHGPKFLYAVIIED
jgi:L-lactate dehydrogenase complex protein LldG